MIYIKSQLILLQMGANNIICWSGAYDNCVQSFNIFLDFQKSSKLKQWELIKKIMYSLHNVDRIEFHQKKIPPSKIKFNILMIDIFPLIFWCEDKLKLLLRFSLLYLHTISSDSSWNIQNTGFCLHFRLHFFVVPRDHL